MIDRIVIALISFAFGFAVFHRESEKTLLSTVYHENWNKRGYIKCNEGGGFTLGNIDVLARHADGTPLFNLNGECKKGDSID